MKDKYDALKLENQLCFPLYACSKEIVRRYKPYLDEIDLTYTQYIAMMVLWERGRINVKDRGRFCTWIRDADTGVKEAGTEGLPHQRARPCR